MVHRISIIFLFNFCFCQWEGYDIKNISYNSSEFHSFIEGKVFNLSLNPQFFHNTKERVIIGFGLSNNFLFDHNYYREKLSGLFPKILANIFVTKNFIFHGSLSQFYISNEVIQSVNWGATIISVNSFYSPIHTSAIFCNLSGARDLSINSVSFLCASYFYLLNREIQIGLGKEMYTSRILNNSLEIPNYLKSETNFLLLGIEINKNPITITSNVRIGSDLVGFSIISTLPVI